MQHRSGITPHAVWRVENQPLHEAYCSFAKKGEVVRWHGTRLRQCDGARTLAEKLRSIANVGFDESLCREEPYFLTRGIWLSKVPYVHFGQHGAFALCLVKQRTCDLQTRESDRSPAALQVAEGARVLPLYFVILCAKLAEWGNRHVGR